MALVPYNFPGSFPDDFLSHITGDGVSGWETDYPDNLPKGTDGNDGNGVADFVDAYFSGDPDLYVTVSQDHAGDGGHAGHHKGTP